MNETVPDAKAMSDAVGLALPAARQRRYTAVAQALHWLTALLAFTVLPLAWIVQSLARGPDRSFLLMVHRSIGLTILALIVLRLVWRALYPAPPLADGHGPLLRRVAAASHWLLYAAFVIMPVSGYVVSAAGGREVLLFGLVHLPGLPFDRSAADIARLVHSGVQWAVYALIGAHLAATAWHVAVRRDGTLDRMLPAQDGTVGVSPAR